MNYDNLPIYKLSLDFCVYIETIVKMKSEKLRVKNE